MSDSQFRSLSLLVSVAQSICVSPTDGSLRPIMCLCAPVIQHVSLLPTSCLQVSQRLTMYLSFSSMSVFFHVIVPVIVCYPHCVCFNMCLCLPVPISLCVHVLCVSVCMHMSPTEHLCVCPSVYISSYVFMHLYVGISVCRYMPGVCMLP